MNAKNKEATRINEKKAKSKENLSSPTGLQANRNVIVDGLRRTTTLFEPSNERESSPKNLNDNSASSKTKAKETKQKLIKNERYNYLSPLKNMLKSKNKSHDEGLKAAAVAAVEAAVLALSPSRKRSESGDKNKQEKEKENEHHHHHHHRRHRRHHHRHHHSENDQENTTKTRAKSKSRNKDSTLDSSTQHRHHHRHRHHHHHHHHQKNDKSQNISSNDTANISTSFRMNQDGLRIKTGEVKKESSKLLKLKSSPFNTILSHKKTKTLKSTRSQRGKSKSRHGSIKSVSRTKKKAHKNYTSVDLVEKNDVSVNQSKTKTKKTLKHKTTRSRLVDFGHMPPESLQSKVSKYLNESKDLQLLSTFSFHNMDNMNSNDKDIIDLSSFSSVTLESNKTSRSASSAESKDRKIGLIPSSKKTHRYQLSGTRSKNKTPSIHGTMKKSEKKLNSSKKPKETRVNDTKSRKHDDESANVTINDGTLNMTSLNSNFNPANSSLNTTKNTNKLDVDTKKKIISNALEQAKTLKPPNIPAPLLLTHPDTPPPILVPPPPLQTLLSNSKNKDKVKTKKSADLNKSHDANLDEMNKFNQDFSSRPGKNSTNLNKIAPPNQPPPPPPIDHTRGKTHNNFERDSVENRVEEDKVDRKHISYKTQVKYFFFC
jgi:hypothetical protein